MFFKELKYNFRNNKLIVISIILTFTISILFFNISIIGIKKIYLKGNDFNDALKKNYYKLSDNYMDTKEKAFNNQPNNLIRLKTLYELLNKNTLFKYMEINFQSLYVKNFKGDNKFFYGYEYGNNQPPILLNDSYYSNIKSVQINKQVVKNFNLNVKSGEMFTEKSYIYNKNKTIPALLGYEYINLYKIGEELDVDYLGMRIKIKICGFLKKNSNIIDQDKLIYLDRYIVIPSLIFNDAPKNIDEKIIQYRIYLNKVNGIIVTKNLSANEVQNIINNYTKKTFLINFSVIGATNSRLDILNLQTKKYVLLTLIISLVIFIFSVISLILSMANKVKKDSKIYAIHLISGASLKDIKLFIILETVIYMLCANCLAIILSFIFLGYFKYSIFILIISLLAIFLSLIIPIKIINKINIITLLKGV